jgi:hypothetical protein
MNSSPPASVGALEAPTIGATVADASDGSLPNPTNARDSRIEALDLVRFLAIIGMMVTHLLVPLAMADRRGGVRGILLDPVRRGRRMQSGARHP